MDNRVQGVLVRVPGHVSLEAVFSLDWSIYSLAWSRCRPGLRASLMGGIKSDRPAYSGAGTDGHSLGPINTKVLVLSSVQVPL